MFAPPYHPLNTRTFVALLLPWSVIGEEREEGRREAKR